MLEKDWRENDIEPIRCAADKGTGEGPENPKLIARSEQREEIERKLES